MRPHRPPPAFRPAAPRPDRRRLLLGALALGLSACGGGGGGDPAGPPAPPDNGGPPPADGPAGRIVFANSSQVLTWRFGAGQQSVFDLPDVASLAVGAPVSAAGHLVLARELDNQTLALDEVDLAGRPVRSLRAAHELAFFTSAVMFDGRGERIAFGIDEYDPALDDRRTRVLVHAWPGGAALAQFDGYDQPEWVAGTGELVLRSADDQSLHLFDAQLRPQGPLAGLVARPANASFSVSDDGHYVLLEDGPRIQVHDRQGGPGWVAAERISDLHAPRLSPDGRWLACHGIDLVTATPTFFTYVPHVLPFAPGVTVQADAGSTTLPGLAFTGYTMTWLP